MTDLSHQTESIPKKKNDLKENIENVTIPTNQSDDWNIEKENTFNSCNNPKNAISYLSDENVSMLKKKRNPENFLINEFKANENFKNSDSFCRNFNDFNQSDNLSVHSNWKENSVKGNSFENIGNLVTLFI